MSVLYTQTYVNLKIVSIPLVAIIVTYVSMDLNMLKILAEVNPFYNNFLIEKINS